MTVLEKIDYKLAKLPEYLRYRAKWHIKNNPIEILRMYNELGMLPYKTEPAIKLLTFNQWFNRTYRKKQNWKPLRIKR